MSVFERVPVLRSFYRYYREITREAPLQEFANYDEYWSSRVRENRVSPVLDRYRTIASFIHKDASVLDIGCGEGAFLRYMKEMRPDCRIMGADVSQLAVSSLAGMGLDVRLLEPDKTIQETCGTGWDAVVLMEVIEHIVDAEEIIRQVVDLRPGRIYITIPNVGFLLYRLRLFLGGRFPITSIFYHMKEHVRFWTVKDFYQWAEVNGLAVVTCKPQVDRGDRLVRALANLSPAVFADRVVYELKLLTPRHGNT